METFRISQLHSSLDDPNFIGNIQSTIVGSQLDTGLLPSIGRDQGVDLGCADVIECLHSCLIWWCWP